MNLYGRSLLILLLASILICVASTHSFADSTYVVKKGDSLYKIAKESGVSIRAIKKTNGLRSSRLSIGKQLTIPDGMPVQTDVSQVTVGPAAVVTAGPQADTPAIGNIETVSPAAGMNQGKLSEFIDSVVQQTIGIPYRFGSNSARGTDCSGYVQRFFSFFDIDLPRSAREQFNVGTSVDREDLSVGDLVFFKTYAPFPSHVGVYLGNDLFIHASRFAKRVTIDNINTPYFFKRYIGARRLLASQDEGLSD